MEPSATTVKIHGDPREGSVLRSEIVYVGGFEGDSLLQWYRCKGSEIVAEVGRESYYHITWEDCGFDIRLVYTPGKLSALVC